MCLNTSHPFPLPFSLSLSLSPFLRSVSTAQRPVRGNYRRRDTLYYHWREVRDEQRLTLASKRPADKEKLENTPDESVGNERRSPRANETRFTKIAADANAGRRCSQSRGRGYLGQGIRLPDTRRD